MPEYIYRGMLRNGKMTRGKMTCKNKREVIKNLKNSRIQPIIVRTRKASGIHITHNDVKKIDVKKTVGMLDTNKRRQPEKVSFAKLLAGDVSFGIKTKDILTFTNSLYILKKAKFNNIKALESLYDVVENRRLKTIVDDMIIGVEGGQNIYEIMDVYPKVFPPIYTNFVKVGEESGSIDKALLYARDYLEESMKLKKQIRGILLPKLLMFVGVFILLIIGLIWGTPLIQNVYDMFGSTKELPKLTQIAVKFSKWIIKYWYIVIGFILGVVAIMWTYIKQPYGRYQWDRMKIKIPIIGRLNLNIITNKFFKAMLLNLRNGLRIQDALDVAKTVTNNYYFLSLIEIGKNDLLAGGSWIEPFEREKALPPMVIQMVNIGMESDLTEMMDKVAEYLSQEINETIAKTVKALPEVMYIFIGIILIFFVLTIMMPLIDVYMGGFLFDMM